MDRKEYQRQLKTQLKLWEAEIDNLQAKADQIEAEARTFYLKQIQELRAQQKTAREKLQEAAGASDSAWKDLQDGLDKAWSDLGAAVKSAVSRFR